MESIDVVEFHVFSVFVAANSGTNTQHSTKQQSTLKYFTAWHTMVLIP